MVEQTDLQPSTLALEQKYSSEVTRGCIFDPTTETPVAFRERILALFPDEDQQAYLNGLWLGAIPGEVGMDILLALVNGTLLSPKAAEYFPPDLNVNLKGADISNRELIKKLRLRLSPAKTAEIIYALNLAAFKVEQCGNLKVEDMRKFMSGMLLNMSTSQKKTSEVDPEKHRLIKEAADKAELMMTSQHTSSRWRPGKIPLIQAGLRLIRAIVGKKILEHELGKYVNKQVNHQLLGLLTPSAASGLRAIANDLNHPFDPIQERVEHIRAGLALDNLDICPIVGDNIRRAVRHDFGLENP